MHIMAILKVFTIFFLIILFLLFIFTIIFIPASFIQCSDFIEVFITSNYIKKNTCYCYSRITIFIDNITVFLKEYDVLLYVIMPCVTIVANRTMFYIASMVHRVRTNDMSQFI